MKVEIRLPLYPDGIIIQGLVLFKQKGFFDYRLDLKYMYNTFYVKHYPCT